MKAGGGKRKGGSFERQVCKDLSRWVTGGKREDVFWRSAMSGGRATVAKGKVRQAGDITAVSPEGHALTDKWFIECKHVKNLHLDQFLFENSGKLAKFWKTAKQEAKKYNRDPMVIAKQNRYPVLVITKATHLAHWVQPIILSHRGVAISLYTDLLASDFRRES